MSALSTAGLQGPDAEAPDTVFWFVGAYLLVGVPVFAMCVGQAAGVLVERFESARLRRKINVNLTRSEFQYAERLGEGPSDDVVDFAEFLQLSLLRIGAVDREVLAAVRTRFAELDASGDGRITRRELHAQSVFDCP